jgi:predicted dehydrogenase
MSKTYNWGIIGLGKIAQKFADDLAHVPNAKLHAVASRGLSKAQEFADHYNTPHAYGSYEEILDCQDLDIVYIATPHNLHYQNTMMCLNAGVAVLNEKPFAVNLRQAQEMVMTARQKGVFLMEALWTRYHPSVAKVLEIVNAGTIGQLVHIQADFGFKPVFDPKSRIFDPELAGGSLLDIGIYPLFISKLLLGHPKTVKAVATPAPTGTDMNCAMALAFENGATASLFSTVNATTDTVATIYGTEGKILMHSRFHETFGITLTLTGRPPQEIPCERLGWGYPYEAMDAQRCLAEGRTENNLWDLQKSLEMMALMDDIRQQCGIVYPMD